MAQKEQWNIAERECWNTEERCFGQKAIESGSLTHARVELSEVGRGRIQKVRPKQERNEPRPKKNR